MNKINIGDRFILKDDKTIVEVTTVTGQGRYFTVKCINYPIIYYGTIRYTPWSYLSEGLVFRRVDKEDVTYEHLDIKRKLPSLKEKIDLL